MLKYKRQKAHILAHIKEAFIYIESYLSTEEGKAFFKTMLQYLYKTNNFEEAETKYLMENIFKTEISEIDPDNIDNTYDRLLYEGYLKGKRETKAEAQAEVAKAKAAANAELAKAKAEEKKAKAEAKREKMLIVRKTLQKFPAWTDKEVADFVEIDIKEVKKIRKDLLV